MLSTKHSNENNWMHEICCSGFTSLVWDEQLNKSVDLFFFVLFSYSVSDDTSPLSSPDVPFCTTRLLCCTRIKNMPTLCSLYSRYSWPKPIPFLHTSLPSQAITGPSLMSFLFFLCNLPWIVGCHSRESLRGVGVLPRPHVQWLVWSKWLKWHIKLGRIKRFQS